MHFLAKYYNMTEFHYDLPDVKGGRTYLMEVNPHYVNGSTSDWLNVIDARWIDTTTGLFIDISTVRPDQESIENGEEGALMCKDKHIYNVSRSSIDEFEHSIWLTSCRKRICSHYGTVSSRASTSKFLSTTRGY